MTKRTCSIEGCDRPYRCSGYCGIHYDRVRKTGSPDLPTTEDRFWAKVDKGGDCWLWTGAKKPHGYGNFGVQGGTVLPHRFAYELLIGPIPDGHEVDHLCYQPACVNPDHLEAVEPTINKRRQRDGAWMRNARKTHCKHGHPFDAENTRITSRGHRSCRQCTNDAWVRFRARQEAAQVPA